MSETTERKPDPNNPESYSASPAITDAVAPVIAQMTGGNTGNTLAGVQGAIGADNSWFSDIGAAVSKATAGMSAAFQAYKAGSAAGSAGLQSTIDQLSAQKAQAGFDSGIAKANITGMDALHKAAAALATQKQALSLGLDPNGPEIAKANSAMRANADEVTKQTGSLAEMRANGFFDNPAKYLVDRIINMPIAEGRAKGALNNLKEEADKSALLTQTLGNRNVVDTLINTTDTTNKAAELYKGALADATAVGVQPLLEAQQIKIGAYHLDVAQGQLAVAQRNAAVNEAELSMKQALLPGQLANQASEAALAPYKLLNTQIDTEYKGAAKESLIGQQIATTNLRTQETLDKIKKDQETEADKVAVNQTIAQLGGTGAITNLKSVPVETLKPLLDITNNYRQFGSLGQTPAQAYELLKSSKLPLNGMAAGHLATFDHIGEMYNQAVQESLTAGPNRSRIPKEDLKEWVDANVSAKIRAEGMNITANNKILQMPSVGTIVDNPRLSDNPIMQAMRPMVIDGNGTRINRPLDGSLLLNTAAQLVNDGKLSDIQAAGALKDLAGKTRDQIEEASGFKRFAIPYPTSFNTGYVKNGFGLGDRHSTVDLLNSADTLNKLRLQLSGIKAGEMANQFVPTP